MAGEAGVILNIRKPLELTTKQRLSVRRLKTRETVQYSEIMGAKVLEVLDAQGGGAINWTQVVPALFARLGATSIEMMALCCLEVVAYDAEPKQWTAADVGDLDIEDYSELVTLFCEMHEAAIRNFTKAFARFEAPGQRNGKASPSSGPSTDSSAPATASTT